MSTALHNEARLTPPAGLVAGCGTAGLDPFNFCHMASTLAFLAARLGSGASSASSSPPSSSSSSACSPCAPPTAAPRPKGPARRPRAAALPLRASALAPVRGLLARPTERPARASPWAREVTEDASKPAESSKACLFARATPTPASSVPAPALAPAHQPRSPRPPRRRMAVAREGCLPSHEAELISKRGGSWQRGNAMC